MTDPESSARPLCVLPGREHQAHDGMLICRRHLDELSATLRAIEDETAILSTVPSMAVNYDRSSGGLASELAPLRLDPVAFLDSRTNRWIRGEEQVTPIVPKGMHKAFGPSCLFCDHDSCKNWRAGRRRDLHDDEQDAGSDQVMSVLAVLHGWARVVREERGLASMSQPVTVVSERRILTVHLDWVARQPWVDEFHTELRDLLSALRRANNTIQRPVGVCESVQPDGGVCEGRVWDVIIKPDGGVERGHGTADGEPGFRCGVCRRVWSGTEAVRLRDRMWRDEQERKAAG